MSDLSHTRQNCMFCIFHQFGELTGSLLDPPNRVFIHIIVYFRTVNALIFAMIKENGPVVCLA